MGATVVLDKEKVSYEARLAALTAERDALGTKLAEADEDVLRLWRERIRYQHDTCFLVDKLNRKIKNLTENIKEYDEDWAYDRSSYGGDGSEEPVKFLEDFRNGHRDMGDAVRLINRLNCRIREFELEVRALKDEIAGYDRDGN